MSALFAGVAAAAVTAHFMTPPPSTSYGNPLGTGDRRSSITVTTTHGAPSGVTNIVDGSTSVIWDWTGTSALFNILFDLGSAKLIDEATWYQSSTGTHSTWIWEGSNDNSAYTQIGSSFTLGGALTQVHTVLNVNTISYRYYRLRKTGGGATAGGSNPTEVEFKISA